MSWCVVGGIWIKDADDNHIALVRIADAEPSVEELGRARLIASAPDLLAACELLAAELIPFYPDRQKYGKWRESMDAALGRCYDAVWDALAKVKGETP